MFRLVALCLLPFTAYSAEIITPSSWSAAKNILDDKVYPGLRRTIYCGCAYISDNDSDGSGKIDADACGLQDVPLRRDVRNQIQWEHIVPASLMPARSMTCWTTPQIHSACINSNGSVKAKARDCCILAEPTAKNMLLDLFNLAPAAGQLNQYRSNDPYGEISSTAKHQGFGEYCEAKDLNGVSSGPGGMFEPPNCKKGDLARVWFYMRDTHGVVIPNEMAATFLYWSNTDPVSPWEKLVHDRTALVQGNVNHYIADVTPSTDGSCSWEKIPSQ